VASLGIISTTLLSCGPVTVTHEELVELTGPGSVSEKAKFAKEFVSEERLASVRARLQEPPFGLSQDVALALTLAWRMTSSAKGPSVALVIGVRVRSSGADRIDVKDVLTAYRGALADELRAAEGERRTQSK
jgi:hypothetical protein